MKIWIVNPYGNLPGEGWSTYRSTFMAQALCAAGHSVTWWVSNFQHRTKAFRSPAGTRITAGERFTIRVVPARAYSAHISIGRIFYERSFARNMLRAALTEPYPDVIILAEPAVCYFDRVHQLVNLTRSTLVIDVIDLWPELFAARLPPLFQPFGRLALWPLFRARASLFRRAGGLVAVSRDYMEIARGLAPQAPGEVIYWGMERSRESEPVPCLPPKTPGEITVTYAGTLGETYDLSAVLQAARLLMIHEPPLKFLIAGAGPLKEWIEQEIERHQLVNTRFLGVLTAGQTITLLQQSDLGLCTYRKESTVSMPIKAFDYLGAHLPIVSSLGRELGRLLSEEGIGQTYRAGDAGDLAQVLSTLARDPIRRSRMRDNSRRLAGSFHPDVQYPKLNGLLALIRKNRDSDVVSRANAP